MRKDKIYDVIRQRTKELIDNNTYDDGIDCLEISQTLSLDRANVSKIVNSLWREGKLVKIQTRPVLYLDYLYLINYFGQIYIPSTISKNETLTNYITNREIHAPADDIPLIDQIIGFDGSLLQNIKQAKASINYPPSGIAMVLNGDIGTGKYMFANYLLEYAIINGTKPKKAKFIRINCQDYQQNSDLFATTLLGKYTSNGFEKGIIEQAQSGIVYLENIEFLSQTSLDLVTNIIERNQHTYVGSSVSKALSSTIIAACSLNEKEQSLSWMKHFPLVLKFQALDKRPLLEKIETILDFFHKEAVNSKKTYKVPKDIITLFALMHYPKNLIQLRNEIKLTCSKAFLDSISTVSSVVTITYDHLSIDLLSGKYTNPNVIQTILGILKAFSNNYIVFNDNNDESPLIQLRKSKDESSIYRMSQFIDIIQQDATTIENPNEYINENINCIYNCGDAQLQAMHNRINPIVFQYLTEEIENNPQIFPLKSEKILYGIMLHVSNVLKRISLQTTHTSNKSNTVKGNLYSISAKRIYNKLEKVYKIKISDEEIGFLATYLRILGSWLNRNHVSVLILAQGNIASQYHNLIEESNFSNVSIDYIDINKDMQFNDCLEIACLKVTQIDQGAGVIILCDGIPFTNISEFIQSETNIRVRSITPLSYELLYQITKKCDDANTTLDSLSYSNVSSSTVTIDDNEDSFINQVVDKFINDSLTFLDTKKSIPLLNDSLVKITSELSIQYSNEIVVKFLCHCSHMLERVISQNTFKYPKSKEFMDNNKQLFNIIEKNFEPIERNFGISIPNSEYCFICEIFQE